MISIIQGKGAWAATTHPQLQIDPSTHATQPPQSAAVASLSTPVTKGDQPRPYQHSETHVAKPDIRTTSQNRNPRSTSRPGDLTPGNVSSQISRAIALASRTPSAFGSRTLVRLFRCVSASKYTLASTPNPVLTSDWKGSERAMSNKSSRFRLASVRRSMFSDVTSSNVRSARVNDRTNELNTSSSRDRGADHGWGCVRGNNTAISSPRQKIYSKHQLALKLRGTMLSTRITSNMHDFSSSN